MKKASLIFLVICLVLGCGLFRKTSRVEHQATTRHEAATQSAATELSGNWNDAEARRIAREMMADCLSRAWIPAYEGITGNKPVVTVGSIHNWTGEQIDTKTFITHFEQELSNSDQVSFVSNQGEPGEVPEEGHTQQEFASRETIKRVKAETGANFMLVGAIKSIADATEGTKVAYYQTDLEMINTKTLAKVWASTKKIAKEIGRKKVKS